MPTDKLSEPSVSEEYEIEEISTNLYRRVEAETDKLLRSQLTILGVDFPERELGTSEYYDYTGIGIKKILYPDDPLALATYEYNGIPILGIRISENRMAIEFDVPGLKQIDALANKMKEIKDSENLYGFELWYEYLPLQPLQEGKEVHIERYLFRKNRETGKVEKRALYAYNLRKPGEWQIVEQPETKTDKEVQDDV